MSANNHTMLIGNRYLLHEQLGEGGMGAVFRATDRLTDQTVALKRVTMSTGNIEFDSQSHGGDSVGLRVALAQEFRTLASLRHPHIISVLDYGFDSDGQPYFTMDLLTDGMPLVKNGHGKSFQYRVNLLVQMLQALAYLHRRGVIHRDLKPGNVMVRDESVKVLDFGLAVDRSVTETGETEEELAGTLAYIAPEVLMGDSAREAADLYAVGVMAYELFTGKHPFNVHDLNQLLRQIAMTPPDLTPINALKDTIARNIVAQSDSLDDATSTSAMPSTDTGEYDVTLAADDIAKLAHDASKTMVGDNLLDSEQTITGANVTDDSLKTFQADVTAPLQPQISDNDELQAIQTAPLDAIDDNAITDDFSGYTGEYEVTSYVEGSTADNIPLAQIIERLLTKSPEQRYTDAYEVIEELTAAFEMQAPEESAAIRESFLQAAKFIGRTNELNELRVALNKAQNSNGSAWLIGGVSGVGKSRLVDELRTQALVRGVIVLKGQGIDGGGLPYQLWREPLRRLALVTDIDDIDASILKDIVPDIGDLLQRDVPDASKVEVTAYQQRLIGTITSVFQRQQQPILLILEDLQWMRESLDMLQILNGIIEDLPLLILATYQSENRPDLPTKLPNMREIRLPSLDPQSISELSVSMLGDVGREPELLRFLQRETEGNVYFMVEIVRALAEEAGRLGNVGRISLPDYVLTGGVQRILERRLERLPEEGQRLLDLAAVAGRELDLAVLEIVSGETDLSDWLALCNNSAILEIQDGNWQFAHGKLRQTQINSIDDATLPLLHRQIAEAIETIYPDSPEHAPTLVNHWRAANNPTKEQFYALQAGEYLLQTSAFNEAIEFLQRALELLPLLPLSDSEKQSREMHIRLLLGETLQYTGDYDDGKTQLDEALTYFDAHGADVEKARALLLLADIAWRQGNYANATSLAEDSLALYRQANHLQGIGMALNRLGSVSVEQGDYATARPHFEEALATSRASDDQQIRANALNNLGLLAYYADGDPDQAIEYFEGTLEISRATGERRKAAAALLNLGGIAGGKEDFDSAMNYLKDTLAICRTIGERRGVALALHNLGTLDYDLHEYHTATTYFQDSLAISQAIGNRPGATLTLFMLGEVERMQEEFDYAWEYYTQALESAHEIDAIPIVLQCLTGLAEIHPEPETSVTWLAHVLEHAATAEDVRKRASKLLDDFRLNLPQPQFTTKVETGKSTALEHIVDTILHKT